MVANYVPKFNSWRLTFTFPLIIAARRGLFFGRCEQRSEN